MTQYVSILLRGVLNLHQEQVLAEKVCPIFEACDRDEDVEIDLDMTNLSFVTPMPLAMLTAVIIYALRKNRLSGQVRRPRTPELDAYLTRMGFYELLKIPAPYFGCRRDSSGRFVELVEVESEGACQGIVSQLMAVFAVQMTMSGEALRAVQHSLYELIENVFHHAESPVNPIVCAQTYGARGTVEFAIVDCGRGFQKSLLSNSQLQGKFSTAAEALSLAVKPKITGRPDHNAGEGLFFTTQLVKTNRGNMIIHSEDGMYRIMQGNEQARDRILLWRGATVALSLNTTSPMDMTALFNQYAPEENDYEFLGKIGL